MKEKMKRYPFMLSFIWAFTFGAFTLPDRRQLGMLLRGRATRPSLAFAWKTLRIGYFLAVFMPLTPYHPSSFWVAAYYGRLAIAMVLSMLIPALCGHDPRPWITLHKCGTIKTVWLTFCIPPFFQD